MRLQTGQTVSVATISSRRNKARDDVDDARTVTTANIARRNAGGCLKVFSVSCIEQDARCSKA
jgi:hypothetical protein